MCTDAISPLNLLAVLPSLDHLVFLGDVINRGAATEATMDLVWDLVRLGRATWLRGNHEQDLIDALQSSNQDEPQRHLMLDNYRQLGEERAKHWLQRFCNFRPFTGLTVGAPPMQVSTTGGPIFRFAIPSGSPMTALWTGGGRPHPTAAG